jgi:hypothetical protein
MGNKASRGFSSQTLYRGVVTSQVGSQISVLQIESESFLQYWKHRGSQFSCTPRKERESFQVL